MDVPAQRIADEHTPGNPQGLSIPVRADLRPLPAPARAEAFDE